MMVSLQVVALKNYNSSNFLVLYLKEIRHNKIYVLLHDLKITSRHKDCIFLF